MLSLSLIGSQIARERRALGLSQSELARKVGVSRATVQTLENARCGELGFSKVSNILSALGLELKVQGAATRRPTLDEIRKENHDQSLDRRK
jgi:transcriptional regulator with XRE-family HTH domain